MSNLLNQYFQYKLSRFRFTWNNPPHNILAELHQIALKWCVFMTGGKEYAPTTGTPHIQGFLILNQPMSIHKLRAIFKKLADVRTADASTCSNINYCSKQDREPFEYSRPGFDLDDYIMYEETNSDDEFVFLHNTILMNRDIILSTDEII